MANFGSYNKTYGSIAGVIIFLVWLWITNLAILLGAELNAELERGRAIAGGQSAEEKPYVEFRDTRAFGDEQRRDMGLDEGEDGDEGVDREGREGGERRGEAAPGPRRERPGTGA